MLGLRPIAIVGLAVGCAGGNGEPLGGGSEALIYGSDDRREPFQATEDLAETARASVMAVMPPAALDWTNAPELAVRAAPLSAWDDFCPGERFLEQPTAAACGAVLIDDDLALTAAHCLEGPDGCRGQTFVFDYLYDSASAMFAMNRESSFGCRAVAAELTSAIDSDELYDYAVVQLDRPATSGGRAAVEVRAQGPVNTDEELTVFGFPRGVPMKVDDGGLAGDAREPGLDAFTLAADTYDSSSGSAVLDADGTLAGVITRGRSDFESIGKCRASRVVDEAERGETAGYAFRAVEALCAAGWPSERLCGTSASCGDGVCSDGESAESCGEDCAAAECGDLLCEASEWETCPEDCGDRRPANVPNAWYCLSEWYDDGETCDCECGAVDADCAGGTGCESLGPGGREPTRAPERASSGGCSVLRAPVRSGRELYAMVIAVAVALGARRGRRSGTAKGR